MTAARSLKALLVLTLPTLVLCALVGEVVLRTVVPAAEFPLATFDATDRILKYDVHGPRTGIYTLGPFARPRARWRINDDGWNSAIEYAHARSPGRRRIVVIGDSYVEAIQVDPTESAGAVLRALLHDSVDVYTLGISSAPLSQYLQMARYAARTFHPDVIVVNVVHNDFDQSVRTLSPTPWFLQFAPDRDGVREVAPTPYVPGAGRRLLRRSALLRYLVWNCKIAGLPDRVGAMLRRDATRGMVPNANVDPARLRRNAPLIGHTVDAVTRAMRDEHPGTRIVYVMDAPRRDVYLGTVATSSVGWLTPLLRRSAESHGATFVDLTPTFARYWAATHRPLNDPFDFHWNAAAHRLVAEALLPVVR